MALCKWDTCKKRVAHLAGSLIMEKNESGEWVMSLNRLAFWIVFAPAVGIWIYGRGGLSGEGEALKDISPNHLNVLLSLLAINFGKRVNDTANNIWGKKKEAPAAVDSENVPG